MIGSQWLFLILPPVTGAVIGYFTNDIAINMLFRPYRALYLGKWQIPFTPGLIPANQERLAKRVADTITGSLLTPEELQNLTKKLLQPERVKSAILWLLQLANEEVKSDKEQKTHKLLAEILRDLFGESLPRLLRVWSRREDFLEAQINRVFDQVLLEFKLTQSQVKQLADWILKFVINPDILRQSLVEFLTEKNIAILDEKLKEKTSGTYWVIANVFGVKDTLAQFRLFCKDDTEIANARLQELLLSLQMRNRLKEWLETLSLGNLPKETLQQLRKTTQQVVREYLQEKGVNLVTGLGESIDWDKIASVLINRLQNSETMATSLDTISQELALLLDRYLEQDIENIMAQVIPILELDKVIVDRVKATTPEELETAVQSIVKSELQAIVNLGGILGFLVGLGQSIFYWFRT